VDQNASDSKLTAIEKWGQVSRKN